MIQKKWRRRLNSRIGERIFLDAHKDYVTKNTHRIPLALYLAYGIAGFVLLTPILMIIVGVWLVTLDFPNILLIILGVVIAASGWMLLPPRARNTGETCRRDMFPALFGFIDGVSDALGATRIDGIHITDELNGYLWEYGLGRNRQRIIGIGLVLWDSASPAQRIAFAAHEVAHQANNDPARGRLISMALHTLEQWVLVLSPSRIIHFDDGFAAGETLAEIFMAVPRLGVELVWMALERLSFVEQQRAEYLADAMAAEVSGAKAMAGLLEKISLNPLLDIEMAGLHPYGKQSGAEVMAQLARSISHAPETARNKVLAAMKQQEGAVDATHPPTAFRIAFLSLLGDGAPAVLPDQVDFAAIESEIAPLRDAMGARLLRGMEVQ